MPDDAPVTNAVPGAEPSAAVIVRVLAASSVRRLHRTRTGLDVVGVPQTGPLARPSPASEVRVVLAAGRRLGTGAHRVHVAGADAGKVRSRLVVRPHRRAGVLLHVGDVVARGLRHGPQVPPAWRLMRGTGAATLWPDGRRGPGRGGCR